VDALEQLFCRGEFLHLGGEMRVSGFDEMVDTGEESVGSGVELVATLRNDAVCGFGFGYGSVVGLDGGINFGDVAAKLDEPG